MRVLRRRVERVFALCMFVTAERGSRALGATLLFTIRTDATYFADANAASVAALSPSAIVTATLPLGQSFQMTGASG